MTVRVRLVGFGQDFTHHRSRLMAHIFARYNLVVEAGEDCDVLLHNCDEVYQKSGYYYLQGITTSLNRYPVSTLLISGENIEEIARFHNPFVFKFITKVLLTLTWRILPRLPRGLDLAKKIDHASKFWKLRLASALYSTDTLRIRSFGKNKKNYCYRRELTQYVRHLPTPKNYVIIPNRQQVAKRGKRENTLPLPYFIHHSLGAWERFIEIKQKRLFEKKQHFCAFIVSYAGESALNCLRIAFCKDLAKYKNVDCYGPVLNNKTIPIELLEKYSQNKFDAAKLTESEIKKAYFTGHGKIDRYGLNAELFRKYKFVICFENSIAENYITEKLPNAMLGNSIGIYHGAPDVGDYFNCRSFINFDDYGSYQAMIKEVIALDQDDDAYARMLRQPFFVDNQVPQIIRNKEKELDAFLDRVFAGTGK